ncbi:MAG: ABC transporter ATP-binding protein [Bacteroidaceae bacterium]|nr:ABC transporter ATP-binding protein [Bacteroidaceae bacterium]
MIRKLFVWLWRSSDGVRLKLLIDTLCGLLYIGASLSFVYFSKEAIDYATHGGLAQSKLFVYGAILLFFFLAELGFDIISNWIENQTEIILKNQIRHRIYKHLMHVTWEEWEQFHSGDVLNRLEEDVRIVSETLCKSVPQLFVCCVEVIAAFIFLYNMNPMLAWSIIFIMPIFLVASKLFFFRMRKLTKDIRSTDSQVQSVMQESLQHHLLIQSMEQNNVFANRLGNLQDTLYGQTMNRTRFNLFSRGMVSIGFIGGYMTAFLWGLSGLQQGIITYGMMTAFLQLVNRIQRPTVDMSRLIPSFVHSSASIDRLEELEVLNGKIPGTAKMLDGTAGIRIEQITFRYKNGERDIYQNFSYDFKPGSRTAIIGETGTGKSTLVKLILSVLYPQNGNIFIYNKEETVESLPETRGNLVYVPQGNSLLSGTIRGNLLLGNANATEEEMWEALHIAAADFVADLPLKLDARCGEWGDGLSEGQAQRIAIARGLLRPGSIILLDEFSSSLDAETERTLTERLMHAMQGKTMIFITHRNLILSYCDNVLRL